MERERANRQRRASERRAGGLRCSQALKLLALQQAAGTRAEGRCRGADEHSSRPTRPRSLRSAPSATLQRQIVIFSGGLRRGMVSTGAPSASRILS